MASQCINSIALHFLLALVVAICCISDVSSSIARDADTIKLNAIDKCWRLKPRWWKHKQRLARCSVGYAGKMTDNRGKGLIHYKVTDPSDNPADPKPGTLRYGASVIKGKVWITFKKDMQIKLQKPLLISSFTAIDGRGADVHIAHGGCLYIHKASNIIIHGLHIHNCQPQEGGIVMGPDGPTQLPNADADAIRVLSSSKVWIDHNSLSECNDGLIDVTRGSTNVTISNNWFKNQNKVMLLGHDDGYIRDKDMEVTIVYNHFGPNCTQRMPRIRYGYAHVVNNFYDRWINYAIGGSMHPRVKSQSNLFIARESGQEEVTWRRDSNGKPWNLYSVGDKFVNGASFEESGLGGAKTHYDKKQRFPVVNAKLVKTVTKSAGALQCFRNCPC